MKDLVGKTIDRYKILGEIGHGGMAVVYHAIDPSLERHVAIKIISTENADKEKLLKRFNREAKILAKLSHSNIVKVLDYGEYEGSPYLVMEYISGGTVGNRFGKSINYSEAAALLTPVARALNYAHQQKVVHRDVKPANILINESGQALISDFGILKLMDAEETQGLTGTGKIVGTPAYMSPEQIRGAQIDGRSDIYSLGICYFELITGKRPYVANTPIEISLKHLNDPIPRARQFVRDIPVEVEKVILKAMAKKPEERYQSMAAFADDLEKLGGTLVSRSAKTLTPAVQQPTKPIEIQKKNWKKPALIILPAIAALSLAGFFISTQLKGAQTPTNPSPSAVNSPAAIIPNVSNSTSITTPDQTISAIQTQPPTETTQATNIETATPQRPVLANAISLQNASSVMEINRKEKISVKTLAWTQDGKWIVNAGTGAILLINPDTLETKYKINLPNEVPESIAISPSADKIYILVKNYIRVFDLTTQKEVSKFTVPGGVHSIALSPNGKYLALGILDNKVQMIDPSTGAVLRNLRSSYGGWSVAFSPDSKIIVGGNSQGALMWEAETGIWINLNGGQNNLIKCLAFSKDGKSLAGGSDGIIFIWDVDTGDTTRQISGQFGAINSVDFSPDGLILAAASDDGNVYLWDPKTGTQIKILTGHTSLVVGAYFSPDGAHLISGANEGIIRLWGKP